MPIESNNSSGELTLASPAKVNLMLSVHGPRGDGFHALTSLVVALQFGDRLTIGQVEGVDVLACDDGLDDGQLMTTVITTVS